MSSHSPPRRERQDREGARRREGPGYDLPYLRRVFRRDQSAQRRRPAEQRPDSGHERTELELDLREPQTHEGGEVQQQPVLQARPKRFHIGHPLSSDQTQGAADASASAIDQQPAEQEPGRPERNQRDR